MSDPLVPNFKAGVGELATRRSDFQNHVDGVNFTHNASAITVIPNIDIGSNISTNVMEALINLNTLITSIVPIDATTTSKGVIKIAGDIGGSNSTATNIVVIGIQGKPISTLTPSNDDVLTWDGYVWTPAAINVFSAGGDLNGNNILQNVIGLTGIQHVGANHKTVNGNFSVLDFVTSARPHVTQETSTDDGNSLIIRAQSSTGNNKNGGPVIIAGGAPGLGGRQGGVRLQFTSVVPSSYPTTTLTSGITSANMVQLSEVAVGRRVLSLCNPSDLTTIDMPASTGDMVMYVRNAVTRPTSGNPSNGAILYARDGTLWIKQQDGNNFQIGTNPNPNIWGPTGQQVYTSRDSVVSIGGSGVLAFSITLPNNTCTAIDVNLVGKRNASTDSAQFNLRMAYSRHGGSPVALGSVTILDSRTSGGASGWNLPSITVSGNTLQIFTGSESGTSIVWLVVTQLSMTLNNI